uniref:Transposase MuDR plant domain-containing protein n=1 Tax=Fagus sylvatica TaxID=28930 RepID=A0A2N9IC04_FAGSY
MPLLLLFRSPQAILSHNIFYMPMLINGDNDVNFMFDVLDAMPQLIGVELYITITPQLVGVDLLNIEDAQHANLEGYGGEDLQGDYNVLIQPLNTPCYDIPTPLEERGGSNYRHEHLSPPLVDGCGPNRSDENAQGVQDDHLDDVFMASQTLHDFDDVHDDYEDELCELIINDCDSHEDDDIHAQHSTPCIPTMEAPSPSFIANTWDNISVPCDDVVTPLSSWDKELEFRKGLIFSDKAEVQYAVKIYSIKKKPERKKHGFWEITKYYGPHTCTNLDVSKDGKMLDSNLIEREIHHLVVKDHAVTIGTLDAEIFKEYKAKVSYFKLWDAKQKAIARIYGDWVKSYEILPMFMAAVQDANPNTVVKWKKKDGIERNTERFHRVFWAFVVDSNGSRCRQRGLSSSHLRLWKMSPRIVGMWFLCCIKEDVTQRKGMCFISDRHKGIEKTVLDEHFTDWQGTNGYWRVCIRHVASNFLKHYKDNNLKNMIMRAGSANQIRKFNTTMECIRRYNEEARIRLDEIPVERWTCSHDGGHRYGAMTTNLVECFNGVLKGSRSLSITAMVKFTFFKLANYFDDRRAKIQDQLNSGEVFSKYAMDKFNRCRKKAGGHTVTMFDRDLGVFEIRTSS